MGLIDIGCSNTILDQKLVPQQYQKTIPLFAQFTVEQMDGKLLTYTTKLDKYKISFYLQHGKLTSYIHVDNQVSLWDLNLRQIKLIIGLNFLFISFNWCVITPSGITFLRTPSLTFTSGCAVKRGGHSPSSPSSSHCCNNCNNSSTIINKDLEQEFKDSSLYSELI